MKVEYTLLPCLVETPHSSFSGARVRVLDPHGEAGYRRVIGMVGGEVFDLLQGGVDFLQQVG